MLIFPFPLALYGSIFADESEAAFSNYRMWESIGFIIAFAYSFELCTSVKLYVITSVLVTGWIGFAIVEYMIRQDKKQTKAYTVKTGAKGGRGEG